MVDPWFAKKIKIFFTTWWLLAIIDTFTLSQAISELLVLVPKPRWLALSLQNFLFCFYHIVVVGLH
jgi:hypothetical protein